LQRLVLLAGQEAAIGVERPYEAAHRPFLDFAHVGDFDVLVPDLLDDFHEDRQLLVSLLAEKHRRGAVQHDHDGYD